MIDELMVSDELQVAAQVARQAFGHLREIPEDSPGYQKALNRYLQSTIRYMSIVTALQARQHELLTEEVAELRAQLAVRRESRRLH
jgi:hypothetical protein